jgi:hypothetical protein
LVAEVKPSVNSVEVHPQLSNNRHPVDGELVGAGSLWPKEWTIQTKIFQKAMLSADIQLSFP